MTTHPAPLAATARELRAGGRDLHDYVDGVCDRIGAIDPDVRALVAEPDRRERLHADAEAVRGRYPADDRPPLYGVPVGIKDNIHVDGFGTRDGSALPPELLEGPEAAVVSDLREAGALILGKTAAAAPAGAPAPTRNPHDPDHTPGGSSSGSAAAVAAGMCPLAVGTQTGGSVIRPAAFCGIVGFKPTFDRIPTDGVIFRSESLDTVGLFAQGVEGVALAAPVVCDGWEGADPGGPPTLGIPVGPYLDRASAGALDAFDVGVARLEDAGYPVERVAAFGDFGATDARHRDLAAAELALSHADWFDEYEAFYRTASAEEIRRGRGVTMGRLAEGRALREERRRELTATMDAEGIDAWVCPAAPGPAPEGITSTGSSVMNRPWTDAGFPAVTLPAGTVDGLPVGLQCVARYGADERLLAWAGSLADAL